MHLCFFHRGSILFVGGHIPWQTNKKRIYGVGTNFRLMDAFFGSFGDMRRAKGQISDAFEKRIMLAVTQVNGCRMCSYFHTAEALKMGMDETQVRGILGGDLSTAPSEEMTALLFAQHYAETTGCYDADAWQRVVDTYGADKARGILAYIRAIMMGNAQGNIVGALQSRLKGQPEPNSTLGHEIGVLAADIVFIPLLLIKAAGVSVWRGIASIFRR